MERQFTRMMPFSFRVPSSSTFMIWLMILAFHQGMAATHFDGSDTLDILPDVFIAEFSSSFKLLQANNPHELFYRKMALKSTSITPRLNFTSSIFTGVSFHTRNPEMIASLAAHPDIAAIWPVTLYPRPSFRVESSVNTSNAQITLNNFTNNPHVMTGIDKLHALGYDGQGIRIAIIDSGVDYKHPFLGGGFGPGYKIVEGYDFAGDSYNGFNTPVPDGDPMDCTGHGTHVAGIIGADSSTFRGAAPNASLHVYRVFGCVGSVANDVLISAILRAYESRVNIISASLGGARAWAHHPVATLLRRAVSEGIVCIFSNGNNASQGLFHTGGPASEAEVMAVGSVNNKVTIEIRHKGIFRVNGSVSAEFEYLSTSSRLLIDAPNLPLYALSFNTSNPADACTPLPSSTPSLANKVVLIRRGNCTFAIKTINAQAYGAKYIIFYTDARPAVSPANTAEVGNCMVSAEQGAQWISYLQNNLEVTVDFSESSYLIKETTNNITGSAMSDFSSWSPTYDLRTKPDVSAPGGSILSTYLTNAGMFAVLSGTSMATPLISGVAALYKQAHGVNADVSVRQILTVFGTSTQPLPYNDGKKTYSLLAPAIQQGGGLINAWQAVTSTTFIRPHTLALNDTVHFRRNFKIMISNNGPRAVTYKLNHRPSITIYTLNQNSTLVSLFPPENNLQTAKIIIQRRKLTVARNSTVIVRVAFIRPIGLDAERLPVYSGYIQIKSNTKEVFHISYSGVATSMKRVVVTDFEHGFPYISNGSDLAATALSTNDHTFQFPNQSVYIHWNLAMGSSLVRIDVLGIRNNMMVAGRKIVGSIAGFPVGWIEKLFRDPAANPILHRVSSWDGRLDSNKTVPAGYYRFLYRALKLFGKPENKDDYETWTSPRFRIIY